MPDVARQSSSSDSDTTLNRPRRHDASDASDAIDAIDSIDVTDETGQPDRPEPAGPTDRKLVVQTPKDAVAPVAVSVAVAMTLAVTVAGQPNLNPSHPHAVSAVGSILLTLALTPTLLHAEVCPLIASRSTSHPPYFSLSLSLSLSFSLFLPLSLSLSFWD
ncbi:unnamed protein product [Protopolystoma xenopodis]|uniref:Uncharacterized protein n=1 Tax=Protopolystoma xenopodis TaxID=117903 RepID=A0A3S5B4L2_9PLAT|nr:unnamed protein product [Protopolystoma xenopodis]